MDILEISKKKININFKDFLKKVDNTFTKLNQKYFNKIEILKNKKKIGKNIFLIDISNNPTNCFKVRGALSEVLSKKLENIKYLCAASSGSFGISVALSAKLLKKQSIIFAPKNLKSKKKKILKKYNARVIYSEDYEKAKENAKKFSKKKKHIFINGLGKNVLYGNGTYFKELFEREIENLSKSKKIALIVPLGIGSLALPAGLYLGGKKTNFDLHLVEPKNYSKFQSNLKNEKIEYFSPTLADGAAVKVLPKKSYSHLLSFAKTIITLNENEIAESIKYLDKTKIFKRKIEGAGALAFGAFLFGSEYFKKYKSIYIFITGKNK
tara:strand:- start:711 stop:1682 length:972 start_codon:yes stop_codon:yes gene_type:complete